MKRYRLYEIDRAKGLAIFLVVLGHLVARKPPEGNEWYVLLKFYIYKFHMPFFMFLSGFIFAHSYKNILNIRDYLGYVESKFKRLAPGFLIFGSLILLGKYISENYIFVDHVNKDILTAFYYLMVKPPMSGAGSLWYIYVLLELYIFFPLLIMLVKNKSILLIVFSMVLYFIPITEYFMLDRFFEYALFFTIGIVVKRNYNEFNNLISSYGYIFIVLFLLSFFLVPIVSAPISKLVCGLFSIPALMYIVKYGMFKNTSILQLFGKFTYSIYLLNTIIIGVTKGVLLIFIPWDGTAFFLFFPILLMAGLMGSIFIKKYIINRVVYLRMITM